MRRERTMKNRTAPYWMQGSTPVDYERHPVFGERPRWRRELHRVIFGHETPAGKAFDVVLIVAILASVAAVMLESVASVREEYGPALRTGEWGFTLLFTAEYVLRLIAAERARRYARSFYGIIDLLAILPTYMSIVVPGGQALAVIRILRVLRVFRVLKLAQFVGGERVILGALRQSAYKITVFLIAVVTVVVVVGAAMYFIEGASAGYTSIPVGMYWAIVTLTTVGFGDITPVTPVGQTLAAMLMVLGYAIIAVPTGIVTAEMVSGQSRAAEAAALRVCPGCGLAGHDPDARFCRRCGSGLAESPAD